MARKSAVLGSKIKRKRDEDENSTSDSEEIDVRGLIDDEASEESDEELADEARETSNGVVSEPFEADSEDSEEELNALLGEEVDVSDVDSEDFSDEPKDDAHIITDQVSRVRIRSLSDTSDKNTYGVFADGTERVIKPEIDPVYDSDDSDHDNFNTIGDIPLSAYEEMPHIGYDINGKRIMRPAKGSALDQLLESIDLPEGWTGLLDLNTGSSLKLTDDELELIRKIQHNENTDENINPYQPTIEWFTSKTEVMPLTAVPEPKRRFVPSKHEAKRIMKIVRAIREGRIVPLEKRKEQADEEQYNFDLWDDSTDMPDDHVMTLRAPKLPPPTNDESYNPPEEYLMTAEERKQWEETEPAERETNFVPQKYGLLRKVPAYQDNLRERFERSLDLYLAPRVRHNKLNIDPDSLIPDLPSPKDLRPFPIKCSTVYRGHTGRVRTISIDPLGLWLATGGDDGIVRVWEILTGRQVYHCELVAGDDDHIDSVEWNPDAGVGILAVAAGENIYLLVPTVLGHEVENAGRVRIEAGWGYGTFGNRTGDIDVAGDELEAKKDTEVKKEVAKWLTPMEKQSQSGVAAIIQCKKTVKKVSWHRKGDYFVSVSPDSGNTSVLIHQLSKHLSQLPFRKSKGIIVDAKFHPYKPQLFVASQRTIKIYDLAQQTLAKKLMPGARYLSGIDIHPRGDHLLASSYDKRVLWHDLDLSATPYKTLRYHEKAVRNVSYHKGRLPLFASAADDGSIHVFHGTVYDDLMTNPLLVPLKKLTGHKVVHSLGVLDLVWHPKEAWLFTAGADGTARLWTT